MSFSFLIFTHESPLGSNTTWFRSLASRGQVGLELVPGGVGWLLRRPVHLWSLIESSHVSHTLKCKMFGGGGRTVNGYNS